LKKTPDVPGHEHGEVPRAAGGHPPGPPHPPHHEVEDEERHRAPGGGRPLGLRQGVVQLRRRQDTNTGNPKILTQHCSRPTIVFKA
jgi:hypothetical protein